MAVWEQTLELCHPSTFPFLTARCDLVSSQKLCSNPRSQGGEKTPHVRSCIRNNGVLSPSEMEGLSCPQIKHLSLHSLIATGLAPVPEVIHLPVHVTRARPRALLWRQFFTQKIQENTGSAAHFPLKLINVCPFALRAFMTLVTHRKTRPVEVTMLIKH